MSAVANQLENYSIYINLSLRGAQPGFHWSIFITTNKFEGEVWHAVNRNGGWSLETNTTNGVPSSMGLCLVLKLGTVSNQNWETLRTTLANIPSGGQPSLHTREIFTCRVWVKDAICALHNAGVVRLAKSIETIEKVAIEMAEDNRASVELGTGEVLVLNSTGFSDTA
ncbi:hypothetical protein yc1106_04379 [Curvularia clavata]|uniref:Uncharacterized protein n=1 Tax=Curvularia clavata TaxID=95742 RepID=A0A9Q8Z8G5_CURCL|nr:hypothetical protein yc1106_04379 [Curvularia clavata]